MPLWRRGARRASSAARESCRDPAPYEAFTEVWNPLRHDEVIVCTLPGESSRWVRSDLPHLVARYTGLSVLHVVAQDPALERMPSPPRVHEKPAIGTASVLTWGGGAGGSSVATAGRTAWSAAPAPGRRGYRAMGARSATDAPRPR